MKILVCVFCLFIEILLKSQSNDSLYQRIYSDDFDYIGLFDSNILKELHTNNKSCYILLNQKYIDTVGTKLYSLPKYIGESIFIIGKDSKKIQGGYFFNGNMLSKIISNNIFQRGFSNNITALKNYNSIYLFKMPENTSSLILDLPKELNYKTKWLEENQMSITDDFWIDEDKLYFSFASCPVSCSDYKHYLFFKSKNSLKELKFLKSAKKETNDEFTCLELISPDHKYLQGYTSHSLDSSIIGRWLYNDTLKRLKKILSLNQSSMIMTSDGKFDYEAPIPIGYNFQNKSLSGANYRVELDNRTVIIVPYKFSVAQELAMVKVYYDSLLTKEEVSAFGKYELSILRNLIFAKHNFKFDSDYWQAYFNLFEFYRSEGKRKSRIKDVEKLFSSIDKKNLEMIRREERKRK